MRGPWAEAVLLPTNMPTKIDFDDYSLRGADPDFLAKRRQILAGQLDSIMARPEVPTIRVGQADVELPQQLPSLDTGGLVKNLRGTVGTIYKTGDRTLLNTLLKDLKGSVTSGETTLDDLHHHVQNGLYEAMYTETKGRPTLEALAKVKSIGDVFESAFPRPKIDFQQLKKQMGDQGGTP